METLDVTVISTKKAEVDNTTFRIDGDFFRKDFLALPKFPIRLGDIAYIKSGTTPSDREDELRHGVILLKTTDIRNSILVEEDDLNYYHISPKIAERMSETKLKARDVLINIVGATTDVIGRVSFVPDGFPDANITQAMALLRTNNSTIDPYALFMFLAGKYGQMQVRRLARPTGQYNLNLQELGSFKIPIFSSKLTDVIRSEILDSHAKVSLSKRLSDDAEQILIRALGLEGWQPPEPLTYMRRASEAFAVGRLDAEHFQPKFDALIEKVQTHEFALVPLGDLILPIKNGFDFREFVEEGTPYIRVGDIKNCRIDIEGAKKVAISWDNIGKDVSLRVGDILFTRKGSFGNAAPVRDGEQHAIISSEIMLIRRRPDSEHEILPEFLALFFNSLIGSYQAEKWAHGVAFYSITQDDLNRFLVPIIPRENQVALREKLEEAELARSEGRALLERAKRAVEIAIEQKEAAAMDYLKEVDAKKIKGN